MSLFGCAHKWRKYGHAQSGRQQMVCRTCGQVRWKKVSQFWCNHQYKLDRRRKPKALVCKKCRKVKVA